MKWRQKSDRGGKPAPNCWITESGHTVAKVCIGEQFMFVLTRAGSRAPTAYCSDRDEALRIVEGFDA